MPNHFLIVDDHAVIRAGIISILKKQYSSATFDEAIDEKSCFAQLVKDKYNCIVLDVNMPESDCFRLISNIKRIDEYVPILIFSALSEKVYAKRFFQFGVNGFLSKDAEVSEVSRAVEVIFSKKRYMSQEVVDLLNEAAILGAAADPLQTLSAKEMMVLMYLLQGKGVSEISNLLNCHISTVATYKSRIFQKCGVDNMMALSKLAEIYMPI